VAPLRYWEDLEAGQTYALGSATLSEEEIVAFALKFDPQPFHIDREAAKASMFGGIIASGWHTCSVSMRLLADNFLHPETSLGSPGIDEVRWPKPVRAGDTITASLSVTGKRPSASKPFMGLVFYDWKAVNQNGETVVTMKGTNLLKRRPAG
jgi:acyl dehydratase